MVFGEKHFFVTSGVNGMMPVLISMSSYCIGSWEIGFQV